ncbi:MAG: hypothetical protein ACC645_23100, partial [Pirellulales bacterium]
MADRMPLGRSGLLLFLLSGGTLALVVTAWARQLPPQTLVGIWLGTTAVTLIVLGPLLAWPSKEDIIRHVQRLRGASECRRAKRQELIGTIRDIRALRSELITSMKWGTRKVSARARSDHTSPLRFGAYTVLVFLSVGMGFLGYYFGWRTSRFNPVLPR